MPRQPRYVWFFYLLTVSVVCVAMVWLTVKAMKLDESRNNWLRQTELARQDAKRRDLVTATLWRMDSMLTPLVGPEATRPYALYQPFLTTTTEGAKGLPEVRTMPSPLLESPSQYVRVHFQVDAQDNWTSPQKPEGALSELAVACGISQSSISLSGNCLDQVGEHLVYADLIARLPEQSLRQYMADSRIMAMNDYNGLPEPLRGGNSATFDSATLNSLLPQNARRGTPSQTAETESQAASNGPSQQIESGQPGQRPGQQGVPPQIAQSDRGGRDWQQRYQALDTFANASMAQQQAVTYGQGMSTDGIVREGIANWFWKDGDLYLARRVTVNDQTLVQGCWMDWPALRERLLNDVRDLMTGIDLRPVTNLTEVRPAFALASVPAQLEIIDEQQALGFTSADADQIASQFWSPIRVALLFAWVCLLFASGVVALLLQGVVKLSERRGAFVSAVTHELRTPLTTFRMYAEMLSEGMVDKPEDRQDYLITLRVEADRLTHLVENVLAYSQLERGGPGQRRESIEVAQFVDRVDRRLSDRAEQAAMKLVVEVSPEAEHARVFTDPAALEQILFNLVENACKYARRTDDPRIHLRVLTEKSQIRIQVADHGPGIDACDRRRLFQPFSKSVEKAAESAPGVGLGLALCRRLMAALGGRIELIDNPSGEGACFELVLPRAEVGPQS